MSNIQTGAERMPHDLSHLGFLAGQIGRLITISTTPVIAGDSFEMDAVGALRLSPLRRGDHRPEGDEKWFLENEKTVTQFCRKLAAERPLKDIRDEYNYPKKKGIKEECSRLLEASTMKSRRGFAIQRLMNAMRQAHADGWFIVFDTLTLADDRLEAFYDNPNALRDYFRDIGRMVLAAEGRKANDSHADCYQYFCVPEYGTANGRLHFH